MTARTKLAVDTTLCEACWDCVQSCPQEVLGKVVVLWHRHVRVDNAAACTGCRKCLRACQHGALMAIDRPSAPTIPRDRVATSSASPDGAHAS